MELKMSQMQKQKIVEIGTIFIIVLAIVLFEIGYCNSYWLVTNNSYNFSICRIVIYTIMLVLYIIFRKDFVQTAIKMLENKTKKKLIYIFSILVFLVFIISICNILSAETNIKETTVVCITFLLAYLFVIYISNDHIKNIIVTACTFGILFTFTTDFNNQIDEKKHFMTAFNLSFLNFDYKENPITDKKVDNLPQKLKYTKIDKFLKEPYIPEITNEVDMDDPYSTPSDYIAPLYMFPALGITIARMLGGSIIDMYIVGRIFNLILYAILLIIALKIIPYKKNILFILAMMPLMLLLAASYSVDGYCIGIIFIFIAYCLKLHKEKETIKLKEFLILCGLFVLVLFAKKMSYIFVGIIIFMLPLIKTIKKNKKYLPIIIICSIISIIIIAGFIIYIKSGLKGDTRAYKNVNPNKQIAFVLENPIYDILVAINQIKRTILNFNWWSMLHYDIMFSEEAKYVALPLLIFILYVALTEDDYNFKRKEKMIMLLSFTLVYAMTNFILYITYTKVRGAYIIGYQTRYIVPIIPFVLFSLSNNLIKCENKANRTIKIATTSGLFLVIGIFQLILL